MFKYGIALSFSKMHTRFIITKFFNIKRNAALVIHAAEKTTKFRLYSITNFYQDWYLVIWNVLV